GGNLGTLCGNYKEARRFLLRAMRHARQRRDHYILARCLRKYGDFLRYRGHLQLARDALLEALRLSRHGRGLASESRKGDFYVIEPGVVYAQKSAPGTEILFIKVPPGNDKVPVDTTPEVEAWFREPIKE